MQETQQKKVDRSFRRLMSRLRDAGFSKDFVERAILPEWWSSDMGRDTSVLPELEICVARFCGLPLATIRDADIPLEINVAQGPRLRSQSEGVGAAVHAALAVAKAVVRNLSSTCPAYRPLPRDAEAFRAEAMHDREAPTFKGIVEALWRHGVPVLHIDCLPSPKFRGMACRVGGRDVIVLSFATDSRPKLMFDLAHEAGHLANGHVSDDEPVLLDSAEGLDSLAEEPWEPSESWEQEGLFPQERASRPRGKKEEREADAYGRSLIGKLPSTLADIPRKAHAAVIARLLRGLAREHQIDAPYVAHQWGLKTREFARANRAIQILQGGHARGVILDEVAKYVDLDGASETDARLLGCLSSPSDLPT
jgi:hypothetical protein